ncbi:uncharacterized protein TNCV_4726981 [Trichonephila clavipes]|nr:uncharacterized protein TNCV_4726981 [Trichonephila clavipes]
MQGDQLCVYPSSDERDGVLSRETLLSWAREYVSCTRHRWASVLFVDESRFTLESNSGRLLIRREHKTSGTINPTLLKDTHSSLGGGIMVWKGISLSDHTDLLVS